MRQAYTRSVLYALCVMGLAPLLHWMLGHVQQDAWWDELISLKDYALVDWKTTLTSYPEPGNHILFNLFNNALSRLLGIRDFYVMLDQLWKLRMAQGILALVSCIYVYLTAKRSFDPHHAPFAVIALTATIPFLNFSLQLRGYNMSMLFVCMVIYHGWSFLENRKRGHLIITSVSSFLLLYTIPSNVYFLFTFSLIMLWEWWSAVKAEQRSALVKNGKRRKAPNTIRALFEHPQFWLLVAVGTGAIVSVLAYMPVWDEMLHNRFVDRTPPEQAFVLTTVFPSVTKAFFSYRWLLLVPVVGGSFYLIKQRTAFPERSALLQLLVLFLMPFILLFMHGKVPFERTFVHLAPIFALLLTGLTSIFLKGLAVKERAATGILALLTLYQIGNYLWQDQAINVQLSKNLERQKREQNMYRAFFLANDFQPHRAVKEFVELQDTNAVVMLVDELDRVSYLYYLEKYGVVSYAMVNIQERPVEAQGRKFSHIGMFQRSMGKGQKPVFRQIPANLDQRNAPYNKLILLTSIVVQMEPGKNIYLFTGFAAKNERAFEQFFKGRYHIERINQPGSANLYRVHPDAVTATD